MIIACPYCQTRYQVAFEAIGAAGRKVQCANCRRAWQASPGEIAGSVAPAEEEALDAAFSSVEDDDARARVVRLPTGGAPPEGPRALPEVSDVVARAAAAVASVPEAAQRLAEDRAYVKRQKLLRAGLPTVKFKRVVRIAAALLFVGVVGGLALGREQVVRQVPEMAGLYEAIGLGVNVVGLELTHLRSVAGLREGRDVLEVKAEIENVAGRLVPVPPVIVTVRDAGGRSLYEWSIAPPVPSLDRGETVAFEARLTQPPPEAVTVKLSFASGRPQSAAPTSSALPAAAPKDAH